jgi:ComF family protein
MSWAARVVPVLSRGLGLFAPPLCWACRRDARHGHPLCGGCRTQLCWLPRDPVVLQGVLTWAPVSYEGPARALVGAIKFRGAAGIAASMAAQIVAGAPADLLAPSAALVPVPLHPSRARRRGFNQAERIAAEVGRRVQMQVADCLCRGGRASSRQVGRDRSQRLQGPAGDISLRPAGEPPGAAVIVDDVVTTGATLLACVRVLEAAGARPVGALAYARTPGR